MDFAWQQETDPAFPPEFILFEISPGQVTARLRTGFQSRPALTAGLVAEALRELDLGGRRFAIPFHIGDVPLHAPIWQGLPVLAYSTFRGAGADHVHAAPDFIFSAWPEVGIADYAVTTAEIAACGARPPESPTVFWIGNPRTNPMRGLAIARFRGMPGFDIRDMAWGGHTLPDGRLAADRYVSLPDHARHQILLDLPAAGYSGRLKLLLWTGRPVIVFRTPFEEFFHPRLRSGVNCVIAHSLEEVEWAGQALLGNPARCAEIGQAGQALAREMLTQEAGLAELRATLRRLYL